ncbi:uncharacterized protein KY384_006276 [Bacidia gigantensis]|uniref:uncharacterized protein n=1 Tax=Bacidia gigantensis TaxID=2732470 RepID=UPI001D0536C2|nr:uncharacterized protein KY384_006276 [Bacidia gigantensis]KAG8528589.1 hypothetical protein KY384_006276 [Bacidia gigantensis]
MTFFIRGYQGFTRKLLNIADEKGALTTTSWLEGPYGTTLRGVEGGYDKATLIVGGSGITLCLSWLAYLPSRMSSATSQLASIEVLWIVRRKEHVQWVHEDLRRAKQAASDTIRINLFVTQESESSEPALKQEENWSSSSEPIDSCIAERPYVPKLLPEFLSKGSNLVIKNFIRAVIS